MIMLNHIIARICSLQSDSDLLKLNSFYLEKFLYIIHFSQKLKITEKELLDTLHLSNMTIREKKINNAIQNIRRNIFNARTIKSKDISVLEDKEQSNILEKIKIYSDLKRVYNQKLTCFGVLFSDEWYSKRNVIKEISQNSDSMKNGLLLSSISLLESSSKQKQINITPSKKEKQIEIGLLKYITRSMFKPTPFSSFTHLNHGKFSSKLKANNFSFAKNENFQIKSHIRINNRILQSLKSCIIRLPDIYYYLDVFINPSLVYIEDTNQYKVLINKNNYEFFQSIEKNTIVKLIIEFLSNRKKVRFIDIASYFKDIIDAEKEDIINYVKKLVNIGLFEFDLHVSGTDIDWTDKLHKTLDQIPSSKTQKMLISLLSDLNILRLEYETKFININDRKEILNKTSSVLNETLIKLHKLIEPEISDEKLTRIKYKKEKIFLEDTATNYEVIINNNYFKENIRKINRLISDCSHFVSSIKDERILYNFYIASYKEETIPLLSFYEDYYRFLKKKKLEKKREEEKKDINIKKYFSSDLFTITQKSEGLIVFCSKNEKNKTQQVNKSSSFSMFFQLSDMDKENPKLIVNSIGWGYGRMSSRFLYMFEENFTQDIKDLNKVLEENKIYSEVNDASFFNANLHPPLFPYECTIPGGHTNVEESYQLKVNQLSLKKDNKKKKLILLDTKSGKQIYIHDSCFQGLKGRSQLFNLLLNFTDKTTPAYRYLLNDLNQKHKKTIKENVFLFPRIIYENTIVLQRKYWIINKEFPIIDPKENEMNYYIRVNIWRKNLTIPSQVYLTLNHARKIKDKKYARDDYKPQFIDFKNPIFIPLISKLFNKGESIKIVEVLPNAENAIDYNKQKFTTEFLVQWYNRKNYDE